MGNRRGLFYLACKGYYFMGSKEQMLLVGGVLGIKIQQPLKQAAASITTQYNHYTTNSYLVMFYLQIYLYFLYTIYIYIICGREMQLYDVSIIYVYVT